MASIRRVASIVSAIVMLGLAASALAQTKVPASVPAAWPEGKVVGWRGDGTGKYPDATPPTSWTCNEKESKNILWKAKLPGYSFATPIIVGNKLITRSDPFDLICLDKNTGKPLWVRSHPSFVGVTADEKKANPAFKEIDAMMADLQKLNDQFVKNGWSKELYQQKHDLQAKIVDLTVKADKKYTIPPDQYCEGWPGYTGATPCSDGKFIYFTGNGGVTACVDLDGKLVWAVFNPFKSPPPEKWEHGEGNSPAVFKDYLLAPSGGRFYLFDKKTGKEFWNVQYPRATGSWGGAVPFEVGGNDYAIVAGGFFSLKDGKQLAVQEYADSTPVIDNGTAYFVQPGARFGWRKLGSGPGGLALTPAQNTWQVEIQFKNPADRWDTSKCYYTASPIIHDGLLYAVGNWGNLILVDLKTAQVVYQKQLPVNVPRNRKTFGVGIGSSPAMAGKNIFVLDSVGCMTIFEPSREYKQIAQNNIDYTVPESWEIKHWTGPHHEQFEACPVFEGGRIYIRGEQFMYCVGEK